MSSFQLLWERSLAGDYLEEERDTLILKGGHSTKYVDPRVSPLRHALQPKTAGSVFTIPLKT